MDSVVVSPRRNFSKWIILPFLFVFVLTLGLVIYYNLFKSKTVKFEIISEISGVKIKTSSDFDKWLSLAFEELRFEKGDGFFEFSTKTVISPKKVSFVFRDINQLSAEEKNKLLDQIRGGDGPLSGYASTLKESEVEYHMYSTWNVDDFRGNESSLRRNMSFHLTRVLHDANPNTDKINASFPQLEEKINEESGLYPFTVEILEAKSLLRDTIRKLTSLFSIREVYAQSPPNCKASSYECGTWYSLYTCGGLPSGTQCSGPQGFCAPGTGTCTYVRQECGAGGGGTWMRDCNGQEGSCSNPDCGGGPYCYNSAFSGSCVPPPAPPPPPQPPPISPPPPAGCTCNDWVPIAQCGDTCACNQRRYTRTCTPSGCAGENQCFDAAECSCSTPPPSDPGANVYGYYDGYGNSPSDPRTDQVNQTLQPASTCVVGGWAIDPDHLDQDVDVQVIDTSNGGLIASGTAGGYRGDLGGVCTGGTCAYGFNLNGLIPYNTNKTLKVIAKDKDVADGWRDLYVYNGVVGTRTINCCGPVSAPTINPIGNQACGAASVNISWSGGGGTTWALRINDRSNGWVGDCNLAQNSGDVCIDNHPSTSYTKSLVAGRQYDVWVHSRNACGEWSPASSIVTFRALSMSLSPSYVSIAHPGTQTFDAIFAPSGTTVGRVDFSVPSGGTSLSVSPTSDTTANPYRTTGTTQPTVGTATVRGQAYSAASGGTLLCTADATVPVTSTAVPWWQVRGGDVVINGSFSSLIPSTCSGACTPVFNLKSANDITGNVNISGGSMDFAAGSGTGTGAEPQNHNASDVPISFNQNYSYDYFANKIPSNAIVHNLSNWNYFASIFNDSATYPASPDGYVYFVGNHANGMRIDDQITNLTRKIVLFVPNGTLTLGDRQASQLTLVDGTGFFMAVTNGNIRINPNVISASQTSYRYEGLFFAGNQFDTENCVLANCRLSLRGAFFAKNGFLLRRNLSDNSATPAEHFEYAPELLMLFPPALMDRKTFWQEVVP